jgi:RNA polymerase sigma-70 factor (ECF subfamily)
MIVIASMDGRHLRMPGGIEHLLGGFETEIVAETQRENDPLERRAVDLVKNGEGRAYDYLVSKYTRRVTSIAWGIVRNSYDAEDLAQEAFVKAYESIGRFRSGEPFGPWIYRIVTNLALDVLKHRGRVREEELSVSVAAARRDDADLAVRMTEIARRIDSAIESLPEMQRVVTRLHLVEEFEHGEIAMMIGLTEGTVRSHLSLARRKLRDRLADLYGDIDE